MSARTLGRATGTGLTTLRAPVRTPAVDYPARRLSAGPLHSSNQDCRAFDSADRRPRSPPSRRWAPGRHRRWRPGRLMAAEVLSAAGVAVDLYDAMASVGRKFLLAGRGGLNLTHAETADRFAARYAERQPMVEALLRRFGALEVRAWAQGLGIETFVGSSGRVFPIDMKAAPLLRAWLHRLRAAGCASTRGIAGRAGRARSRKAATSCRFTHPRGQAIVHADAVLLALGGASWSRLGSDGAWLPWLAARGIEVAPLVPSNCGFDVATAHEDGTPRPGWSDHFRTHQAGVPVKNVALRCEGPGWSALRAGRRVRDHRGRRRGAAWCTPLRPRCATRSRWRPGGGAPRSVARAQRRVGASRGRPSRAARARCPRT